MDDDVDEQPDKDVEMKPVIITSGSAPATRSWASIAASAANKNPTQALKSMLKIEEQPKLVAKTGEVVLNKITRSLAVQDANLGSNICFDMTTGTGYMRTSVVKQEQNQKPVVKKSWADYTTDDESEGEDEE